MDKIILENKLIPVVVFHSLDEVTSIMDTLVKGDIRVAEICFRTECSLEGLKVAVKNYPNILIGAGTIINKKQALDAIEAGAKFIVVPGLSKDVAEVCKSHNITYIPGIVTPTEIIAALDLGIDYVKFFPAGVFGGLKALDALSSAFPQVKFMPTGGVSLDNLAEFNAKKYIFAIGGSFLLKGDAVNNCKKANEIIRGK